MSHDKINEIKLRLRDMPEEKVNKNAEKIEELEFEIEGLKDRLTDAVWELERLEKEGTLENRKDLEKELLMLEATNGELRKEKQQVDYFIILSSLFSTNFTSDSYTAELVYNRIYATEREVMACNGYMATFADVATTGVRENTINSVKFNDETGSFAIVSEKPEEKHIEYIDMVYKTEKKFLDEGLYKKTLLKSEIPIKNRNDKHDYIEFPETKIYFNKEYLKITLLPFNDEGEIEILYSEPLKPVLFRQNNVRTLLLPVRVTSECQ